MASRAQGQRRRSIRLKGYDYAQEGAYFVTICVQDRLCLFGEVVDRVMRLNEAGRMVERWWRELALKFPSVEIDEFIVMPSHFHGVVVIGGADLRVCPGDPGAAPQRRCSAIQRRGRGAHAGAPLPTIVQWFKTMTTNEYMRGVKVLGWTSFVGKLWQRGHYDHVIRSEPSVNRIRHYIINNPANWSIDRENPAMSRPGK